jgi:hypothetical protein
MWRRICSASSAEDDMKKDTEKIKRVIYDPNEDVVEKTSRKDRKQPFADGAPKKRESLIERFHKSLAAIAYAEMGEFETATDLLNTGKQKTVLLVVEGESPDLSAFNYALNLCKRMGAELDILQVINLSLRNDYDLLSDKMSEGSRNTIALARRLEESRVPFKVTIRLGDVNTKLINYAKRHKDVVLVVFDSPKLKSSSYAKPWSRLLEEISRQLSIPLVTVMEKQTA